MQSDLYFRQLSIISRPVSSKATWGWVLCSGAQQWHLGFGFTISRQLACTLPPPNSLRLKNNVWIPLPSVSPEIHSGHESISWLATSHSSCAFDGSGLNVRGHWESAYRLCKPITTKSPPNTENRTRNTARGTQRTEHRTQNTGQVESWQDRR